MDKTPKLTFETGVGTVTGANFLLETPGGFKILVDCGMVQGERVAEDVNAEPFAYDPSSIGALLITHAHLDHVGRIPKLVKDGFRGAIYSTPQTRELAQLVLEDAVGILAGEARQEGKQPLYGAPEVAAVFPLWKTLDYHQPLKLAEGVSIFLKDAGHILGSAMVEVTILADTAAGFGDTDIRQLADSSYSRRRARKVSSPASMPPKIALLFTGDLGNSPAPILRDTEPVGDVDYLVMESVYGDRNHEPREERTEKFEKIIKDTLTRGGTLVIPAFSIDRTQVLLYELNNMVEQRRIASVPVFVDSPMAIKATEIYRKSSELFNDAAREQIKGGDDIFSFKHLKFTMSRGESQNIEHMKGAKIILAGSGMSVGGRVIGHEEHYLPDSKSTILLVGYQTAGSLGRRLADGARKVNIHGRTVKVNAKIEALYGYSAHKDGDHLVKFVETATVSSIGKRLKEVFVAMGEPGASMRLAQRLNDEVGVKAVVPELGKRYEL